MDVEPEWMSAVPHIVFFVAVPTVYVIVFYCVVIPTLYAIVFCVVVATGVADVEVF